MEFAILGPLEVRRDGRVVALGGPKPRALLAELLLHANEPVSPERLAGVLWGEDAPAGAVRTVRVHVSRLRKALGEDDLLTTTPAGYRLRARPGELDLERFDRLVDDGRRALVAGRPEHAGALLRQALALWRGPPLADLAFEPFAQAEIARLEEQRLAAVEARAEADLAAGRHAELVPELQRLVAEHPLRERLHGLLMIALYRCGRQADALQAYRDVREVLVEQLGIEPGSELRALEQAVLTQSPALMTRERSRPGVRLPVPPTPIIGRDAELADLEALVSDRAARLVTVVGPPGVGKTRLAVELAHRLRSTTRDGVVFVSLASVEAPEHVAATLARELGVQPAPGESAEDAVAGHVSERDLLLVLDNYEHVLASARLVADVLAGAPDVTVLATSREPLRVRAERVFRLGPLAVDAAAGTTAPAVALFVALAHGRDPAFRLTGGNRAVADVCHRLDGLPLAIELAAGSLALLTVEELAAQLRQGLGALAAGPRDAPARQRTLSATIAWSHRLLTSREQDAFAALAVFAGGCTADVARAVTGAPLEVLEALVDKNLVVTDAEPGGSRRIGMLETVREFARARLGERDDRVDLHRRHCEHYVDVAERAVPELRRSGSRTVRARLDREYANLEAAFTWSVRNRAPALALRLASAFSQRHWERGHAREAARWFEEALALDGGDVPLSLRARALGRYALTLNQAETTERAKAAARESVELWRAVGDRAGCAEALWSLARVLLWDDREKEAYRCALDAEQLARESGNDQVRIDALATMAETAPTVAEALATGEQAAAGYRALGDWRHLAILQSNLVYLALIHADDALALRLSREALEAAEALEDPVTLVFALGNAGSAALLNDDVAGARDAFMRQLGLIDGHRQYRILFEALIGLAAVAAVQRDDRTAALLYGAAAASPERAHPSLARRLDERCFDPARARLGERAWRDAVRAGAGLDRDQAIEAALSGPA